MRRNFIGRQSDQMVDSLFDKEIDLIPGLGPAHAAQLILDHPSEVDGGFNVPPFGWNFWRGQRVIFKRRYFTLFADLLFESAGSHCTPASVKKSVKNRCKITGFLFYAWVAFNDLSYASSHEVCRTLAFPFMILG